MHIIGNKIQNNIQQRFGRVMVRNGLIRQQSTLHLKSAILGFNRRNMADIIELDLLQGLVR